MNLARRQYTVERHTKCVTMNKHKWKSDRYCQYKSGAVRCSGRSRIGKVEAFYRVKIPGMFPHPGFLQLAIVEPCEVVCKDFGGFTLDVNKTWPEVIVPLETVLCKIHIASHRQLDLLHPHEHETQSGNTVITYDDHPNAAMKSGIAIGRTLVN